MDELGIDMSKHKPVSLAGVHDTSFDLIVTLAPEAHHKALEIVSGFAVDVEYWPTQDPSLASGNREQILAAYRAVRDGLFAKIKTRFKLGGGPSV
jgi:protein-tyrosine-phosphatase